MLTDQVPVFPGRERFADMLVGLLAAAARVEALAGIARGDGLQAADGPLVDLLLGVISAGRTLRAAVATSETTVPGAPNQISLDTPTGEPPVHSWLR